MNVLIGLARNPSPADEPLAIHDFPEAADGYIADLTFAERLELCRLWSAQKARNQTALRFRDWLVESALQAVERAA